MSNMLNFQDRSVFCHLFCGEQEEGERKNKGGWKEAFSPNLPSGHHGKSYLPFVFLNV